MNSFIDQRLLEAAQADFAREVNEKMTPEAAHIFAAFLCSAHMLPILQIIASGQAPQQLALFKMMSEKAVEDLKKIGVDIFDISKRCAAKHGLDNFDDIAERFAAAFRGPGGKTNVQ